MRVAVSSLTWISSNHLTFYTAQVAASKLYAGDKAGALDVLQRFFEGAFQDQIAASGEQPFEGIRANPLHYRAFNLEALLVSILFLVALQD